MYLNHSQIHFNANLILLLFCLDFFYSTRPCSDELVEPGSEFGDKVSNVIGELSFKLCNYLFTQVAKSHLQNHSWAQI